MTSAHDAATAVLNEVGNPHCSESRVGDSTLPTSIEGSTATSMEPSTRKIAQSLELADGHAFTGFQSSSSNNSQTTVPDPTTPPTSDELSSQSQPSPSRFPKLLQTAATQLLVSQQDGTAVHQASMATNAGQKRTFDGYAKLPGTSSRSSGSPPLDLLSGHSRTISTASAASSTISSRELVSELRTRLSYAIVKVNKGWEDLPIDEVESRNSQAGSPTSSNSTLHARHNIIMSPRDVIANLQGHSRGIPQHGNTPSVLALQNDPPLFTDGPPSRTYESFWREQGQKSGPLSANPTTSASKHPSLAPPADISVARRPNNSRRSETPRFTRPPTLLGRSSSDLSQNTQPPKGGHSPTPRTPNRTSHPVNVILQRTNQKSDQERDAIETLLFMSSPGNSNNMNHTFPAPGQASAQPSPLRADFGAPLRSVQGQDTEYVDSRSIGANEAGSTTPRGRRPGYSAIGLTKSRDDIYDIMLDEQDTDSSDGDIEIPVTPRQLAASRS